MAQASQTTEDVLKALKGCPTRSYLLVEQLGVSSADYADGRAAPQLSQYMAGQQQNIKTAFAVPEVVGQVDGAAIEKYLEERCERSQMTVFAAPGPEKAARVQLLQASGTSIPLVLLQCS